MQMSVQTPGVRTKRKPEPQNEKKKNNIFGKNENENETLFTISFRGKTEDFCFWSERQIQVFQDSLLISWLTALMLVLWYLFLYNPF